MSHFDLSKIDECFLRQVVQKFSFRSGAAFYRSCRGAKEFVEFAKPLWNLPYLLAYNKNNRKLFFIEGAHAFERTKDFSAQKFYSIRTVLVADCDTNYIKEVILPELQAVGCVQNLGLLNATMHDEDIRLLLESVNPSMVQICERSYGVFSDVFKNVKAFCIDIDPDNVQSYSTTTKIFELARNRKHLILCSDHHYMEMFTSFLKSWLRGNSTGSLGALTFRLASSNATWSCDLDAVLNDADIQSLMERYVTYEPTKSYAVKGVLGWLHIRLNMEKERIMLLF